MPTYEYRCPSGHEFERFQRMSDKPEAECPECGEDAQRLLSAGGGFIFKGSGFYITDYRSESYRKDQKKAEEKSEGKKAGTESKGKAGDKGSGSSGKGEMGTASASPPPKPSSNTTSGKD